MEVNPRQANIICSTCGPCRGQCIRHLPRKTQKGFTKIRIKPEDKAWADAAKERDGYKCRRCGSTPHPQGLHAAHIFGRSKKATRLDPANSVTLCASCHRKAHDDLRGFHEWVQEVVMTPEEFEELRVRSQTTAKRVKR